MGDPPYSEGEAKELYGLPATNIPSFMNEAARVCESNGLVILLSRLIPFFGPFENSHKKRCKLQAIVGVFTIAGYTNLRALTVFKKYPKVTKCLSFSQSHLHEQLTLEKWKTQG